LIWDIHPQGVDKNRNLSATLQCFVTKLSTLIRVVGISLYSYRLYRMPLASSEIARTEITAYNFCQFARLDMSSSNVGLYEVCSAILPANSSLHFDVINYIMIYY